MEAAAEVAFVEAAFDNAFAVVLVDTLGIVGTSKPVDQGFEAADNTHAADKVKLEVPSHASVNHD